MRREIKPSMGRGSPRVPTGSNGRFFREVFPLENRRFFAISARFCAEKVLMWLFVQTSSLESNFQLPEIRLQLSTPRSGKLEIPNSTSNIWKLEFDIQLLTPGTWISTFTLWKMDSNFQQPTFAIQLPTAVYSGFIRVSAWGKF